MKFCFKPARNFQTAGPSNSTLHATPRNLANWTKLAVVCPEQFSSIKGFQRWLKMIRISNQSGTRSIDRSQEPARFGRFACLKLLRRYSSASPGCRPETYHSNHPQGQLSCSGKLCLPARTSTSTCQSKFDFPHSATPSGTCLLVDGNKRMLFGCQENKL